MSLTVYTSKEAMTSELVKELASYAEDLVTAVAKEHMGFNAYSKALDDFHEQCASSIKTWKYLTYELAVCEDALAETPYRTDWETGYPTGAYADILDEKCELEDECESWANACEELFETVFNAVYEALYGGD